MSHPDHEAYPSARATSVTFCRCHGVHVHLHGEADEIISCALFSDDQQALNHAAAVIQAVEERRRQMVGDFTGKETVQ